ncbi:MAG: EAL domain-containing protein [Pseudomonadota bacterium]
MSLFHFNQFRSLRSQYTVIAVAVGLLILISTAMGQYSVSGIRKDATFNLQHRKQVLEQSRQVRDYLWQARYDIDALLRDPANEEHHQQIHMALANAFRVVNTLYNNHRKNGDLTPELYSHTMELLQELVNQTENLYEIRTNPELLSPAFTLINRRLLPIHESFLSHATRALYNVMKNNADPRHMSIQHKIEDTRYLWSQLTNLFHLYLANRISSYDINLLPLQKKDIDVLLTKVGANVSEMLAPNTVAWLEDNTARSINAMRESIGIWENSYRAIQRIGATNKWRSDNELIIETINPLFNDLWSLLLSNDMLIELSTEADVSDFAEIALSQTTILWAVALLGIFFVLGGYYFLERSVLRPMANVAAALRSEAEGEPASPLIEIHAESKEANNLIRAFREMQKQVQIRQLKLEHIAMHDNLTELPNRALFMDRLHQAIFRAQREHTAPCVIILDLDRFKEINDTFGHLVGDSFLVEVGKRLLTRLRKTDTIARLGGDEFAILLVDQSVELAFVVAKKIMEILGEPFHINGHFFYSSGSMGIASYSDHSSDAAGLLRQADIAMYVAKRDKLGYVSYDSSQDELARKQLTLHAELTMAIDNNNLELYYQPQLDIATGAVRGVEALLRWRHPTEGFIPPDQIVRLAEQRGLIQVLTYWVIDNAIKQNTLWNGFGHNFNIAINLSVLNLQDSKLADLVDKLLIKHAMPARQLIFEITESAMMTHPALAIEQLKKLRDRGVFISIDDYGTGYSSLAYIHQLPVFELKIDRSFIMYLDTTNSDAVIVRSTIDLAHNLGLKVVAEGVENVNVFNLLRAFGCDIAQGNLFCKPYPANEFMEWHATFLARGNAQ